MTSVSAFRLLEIEDRFAGPAPRPGSRRSQASALDPDITFVNTIHAPLLYDASSMPAQHGLQGIQRGNGVEPIPSTAIRSRIRIWLLLAALALAAAFLAVLATPAAAENPPEPHQDQCENGWESAPAYSSCTANTGGVVALTWGCKISGKCTSDDGKANPTSISLEVEQFPTLRNCDGTLTLSASSC